MTILPRNEAITYPALCSIMARLGYDDPSGDIEDQLLQFRLGASSTDGRGAFPEVVTIGFPDSFVSGSNHLGWSRELMIDFLLTTFSGLSVSDGTTIIALLSDLGEDGLD